MTAHAAVVARVRPISGSAGGVADGGSGCARAAGAAAENRATAISETTVARIIVPSNSVHRKAVLKLSKLSGLPPSRWYFARARVSA